MGWRHGCLSGQFPKLVTGTGRSCSKKFDLEWKLERCLRTSFMKGQKKKDDGYFELIGVELLKEEAQKITRLDFAKSTSRRTHMIMMCFFTQRTVYLGTFSTDFLSR